MTARTDCAGTAIPMSTPQSPEEIQREIERTRAQLGQTADALAHKLDPRTQAKKRMARARTSVQRIHRERSVEVIGVVVAAVGVAAVLWRRNS